MIKPMNTMFVITRQTLRLAWMKDPGFPNEVSKWFILDFSQAASTAGEDQCK